MLSAPICRLERSGEGHQKILASTSRETRAARHAPLMRTNRELVPVRAADAVKTALDELRMQMLGTQVLLGFQLQSIFQERFVLQSSAVKLCAFAALLLIVVAIGLLIAPACQHRIVEKGKPT